MQMLGCKKRQKLPGQDNLQKLKEGKKIDRLNSLKAVAETLVSELHSKCIKENLEQSKPLRSGVKSIHQF